MGSLTDFRGDHRWLSNFYEIMITYEGLNYGSTEAAYQSAKTLDMDIRLTFEPMTPGQAKRAGQKLVLRPDWEQVKDSVMLELVYQKFTVHKHLGDLLVATGNEQLIEGNTWGDTYWGVCNGVGQNRLGTILMIVRNHLNHLERGQHEL